MTGNAPQGLGRGKIARASASRTVKIGQIQSRAARRSFTPKTRVVIKANYIRVRTGRGASRAGAGRISAAANYMMFRPGEDGEYRRGFDGHQHLDPAEVQARLGESCKEFSYAYRMVLSPDQNFGVASTEEWASKTLEASGHRCYVVFAHAGNAGHTQHPHAHALVFTSEKLGRDDFASLREHGHVYAQEQAMRPFHDRHMQEELWRQLQRERFDTWLNSKKEISSQGVEEPGGGTDHRDPRGRKAQVQNDFEM